MNQRDARLVEAAERQERSVHALAHAGIQAVEASERREEARLLSACRRPPRLLFGGERGAVALLRGIPGFAELWVKAVPPSYLCDAVDRDGARWVIVRCPCGGYPALRAGTLADCACERWYFNTGESVRVRNFAGVAP